MTELRSLAEILQCPISGAPINCSEDPELQFWSETESHGRIDFPVISGQPVFINFENSIVDQNRLFEKQAASLVDGRRTSRSLIKRVFLGRNPVEISNSKHLLDLVLQESSGNCVKVLVVGGGTMSEGVTLLNVADNVEIISFDVYASAHTDFVADGHAIPIRDAVIDAVWIQAVLEHVLTPGQVVDEIARVLKPDGLVYAETPFLQPVHEHAYDFTRFTELGHRWLFRKFELVDSGVVSGPGSTLFNVLRYFLGALLRNRTAGTIAALPFFWLRFFDKFTNAAHASDLANGVYFLGRKSDKILIPSEVPLSFKGVR